MFLNTSAMESVIFFFEMKDECKVSRVNISLADLLGSQYFFEILRTSLVIKVVKMYLKVDV